MTVTFAESHLLQALVHGVDVGIVTVCGDENLVLCVPATPPNLMTVKFCSSKQDASNKAIRTICKLF